MNIRVSENMEIDKLVDIWYKGSLIAHDFIDKDYWHSQRNEMKEKYLPMSENVVICNEEKVVGFMSMVDDYLAAMFIDVQHQGKGYRKELLNFIKERRKNIHLKVYKKNDEAVTFYLRNGFVKKEERLDELTGEDEFVMEWKKV
ncbi:GNAT family N-acetyltransferase [Pseudalkalibacillus salsuginis]|uniref:GNAT family N-acetyltransferase n=1 Tax=Pseudalkalibacillus salsuginis TaxID=2910972 RepID=UPI001F33E158|nr:GNAT family N-acetyltransferase [Pseudalkalibacillus salsuginis]MCF6409574.1 GNAT family N-acetyltransferase [Pseudalkalibacillus salsuginis]